MAKPIRKTPSLKGNFAERFLDDMIRTSQRKVNAKEKVFIDLITE